MSEQKDWQNMPEVEEAALWSKTSAKGTEFLSGVVKIEGKEYKITVFKNTFKQAGEKTPDYKFGKKKGQF